MLKDYIYFCCGLIATPRLRRSKLETYFAAPEELAEPFSVRFISCAGPGRPMPRLLSAREVKEKLRGLEGWKHRGHFITKTFVFNEFMDGISFLNEVAKAAEKQEHHPDIKIRYTSVTLSIQTHSEGGVTSWDIGLARAIDRIRS
jgi:4a-hydroxytetrahydrobiopterin dehydratase